MSNITRRNLFGKLNVTLFKALESAASFAKLRGNTHIELVHWLHQWMQGADTDLHALLKHYGCDPQRLQQDFARALAQLPAGASSISDFSQHIEIAIERAWVLSSLEYKSSAIRGAWLLAALIGTPELRRVFFGISSEFEKIALQDFRSVVPALIANTCEQGQAPHDGSGLASATPGEASGAIGNGVAGQGQNKSALDTYCTDLTARARENKIDPVAGRSHEIRTMIDILLRRRQNNPLLTGEAGVGKTAVVEGLALAIASGEVPPALQSVRLLSLDVGALLAGASMRGEFEQRLKNLLREATDSEQPVLLFIDEIHTLVGAGGQAGTGDAANLLKPALARGALRTIGATTWTEYKKHIEKDPALTRRFQVLQVHEPEEAKAIEMVRSIAPVFMQHHGIQILDEAIVAAVCLSHRYIPDRQLPDKAISLLDTACARVAMSLAAPPAQVEHLRSKVRALDLELSLAEQEVAFGKPAERVATIQERKATAQAELERAEAAWQAELSLVNQIIAIRSGAAVQEEGETDSVAAHESAAPTQIDTSSAAQQGKGAGQEATPSAPAALSAEVLAELRRLESELHTLQGDNPLIYPEVGEGVVADIVSDWTGIPVGRMVKNEIAAVLDLENTLRARVVGQDNALALIAKSVQTARAGLRDPRKPLGVFLLAGPSGVGKTETALALAEALYGGEQNLISINMSEYQEAHTVSSLKGSPPGYVGYGEGGVLTEAVRRRPYSVILLDEVEKAHSDVHELFYQVFDKGHMEDGEGRSIDFKNTLILLTSNAASEQIANFMEDPALAPSYETIKDSILPELRKHFPAAFIGRLGIVPYLPLGEEVLAQIVRLQLGRVVDRMMEAHGIVLEFAPELVGHIVEQCGQHETGARRLLQFIEQNLLPELARFWLESAHQSAGQSGQEPDPARVLSRVVVGFVDGNISYDAHYDAPASQAA